MQFPAVLSGATCTLLSRSSITFSQSPVALTFYANLDELQRFTTHIFKKWVGTNPVAPSVPTRPEPNPTRGRVRPTKRSSLTSVCSVFTLPTCVVRWRIQRVTSRCRVRCVDCECSPRLAPRPPADDWWRHHQWRHHCDAGGTRAAYRDRPSGDRWVCARVQRSVYRTGMSSRMPWSRPRPRPDHFGSRPRTPMKSYMISEAP